MFFCQEREVMRGNQPAMGRMGYSLWNVPPSGASGIDTHMHAHICTHAGMHAIPSGLAPVHPFLFQTTGTGFAKSTGQGVVAEGRTQRSRGWDPKEAKWAN